MLPVHYGDVIMGTIASQITSLAIVYSTVHSDADQRKHRSSASLAIAWGIHRGPVNSAHKWPVTRKMFHDITNSSNNGIGTLWSCEKSRIDNWWQWILNSISSNSLFSKEVWIDILRKYNQIGLQITCSTPILHPVTECVLLNCRKIYLARNTNGKLPCVPIHEAAC